MKNWQGKRKNGRERMRMNDTNELIMVIIEMLVNNNVKSCPRLKPTMIVILPQKRYDESNGWDMMDIGLLTWHA